MRCNKCGKEIGENQKFCKYCGSPIVKEELTNTEALITCPKCGNPMKAGQKFCTKCGYSFEEKQEKKSSKKLIIILSIIVVLIAGGTAGYILYDNGVFGNKTNQNNASYNSSKKETVDKTADTKKEVNPEIECRSKEGYVWDDEANACLTVDEKEQKDIEVLKTACEATSGKEWDDNEKQCKDAVVSVGGYSPGTYVLNYDGMRVRSTASTNGDIVRSKLTKGTTFTITEVKVGDSDKNSIWGKTTDGWICIKDSSMTYLSPQ